MTNLNNMSPDYVIDKIKTIHILVTDIEEKLA